ncbi:MAG: VWA domain-containing protein, partial [Spirochaetaceae bacterium]|nr:VWA domain-containing protein [Spirochaetaceae bacterium]
AILLFLFLLSLPVLYSQENLKIVPGDAYIELDPSGGFNLWIKKKEGLGSIMLTDSSKDPEGREDSFTLRSFDYNETNGDEKRILNGEFLKQGEGYYFLIDSTTEISPVFREEAFRIYVPSTVTYGYPWSREGQLAIGRGSWLNIRAFERPYADYRGSYIDNPFILNMKELPPLPPIAFEVEEEKGVFDEMASETEGEFNIAEDGDDAVDKIAALLDRTPGPDIDLVLVVDTTVSMKDDVSFIRNKLVPIVKTKIASFEQFRIGIVLYRDYKEEYLTKIFKFESDLDTIQGRLNRVTVAGGRDLPEAVYEGLYEAVNSFEWKASSRLIIQVGDALPHEVPRGAISKEMVFEDARSKDISLYPILLPAE